MTFEQAVERASEYHSFKKNGLVYIYMVAPMIFEDYVKWANAYHESKGTFIYETAKEYCTDSNYTFLYIVKR